MADAASNDAISSAEALLHLKAYASNPPFRSAEGSELILGDDPYRRPVRREDLEFIDFSQRLCEKNLFELSALASHRLLLNIYEASLVFLPKLGSASVWHACAAFHSDRSRVLADTVRPFLESHVFDYLEQAREDAGRPSTAADLLDVLRIVVRDVHAAEDPVLDAIRNAQDRDRAVQLLVIQLTGPIQSKELALWRGTVGVDLRSRLPDTADAFTQLAELLAPRAAATALRSLADSSGLINRPHAYWQFYLTSWMAVANYVHRLSQSGHRWLWLVGAALYDRARMSSMCKALRQLLDDCYGSSIDTTILATWQDEEVTFTDGRWWRLVENLSADYGDHAISEIHRGLCDMRALHNAASKDFAAQITWADRPNEYRALARELQTFFDRERIDVNLETYVESCEERSTTHVHDTDRLLIIERGTMDFWSNFGPAIPFEPGDMIFVPRHRLHGSVVTSEECIYHQPIVTGPVMRLYEQFADSTGVPGRAGR